MKEYKQQQQKGLHTPGALPLNQPLVPQKSCRLEQQIRQHIRLKGTPDYPIYLNVQQAFF